MLNFSMLGMSPSQMRRLMKDISMQELNAKRVIIEMDGKKIVIENPKITSMQIQGQKTYTVLGKERVEEETGMSTEIAEEDISLVQQKTGKSRDEAIRALKEANNDLALAIKKLTEK
ncbi:MAG: nascent polypeptide-associated complex protein [Candidatus Diapherotrites archaeon]|nr:nascent polypeptide-associated complex protein [Candidatus Diapherotrites archaeon]